MREQVKVSGDEDQGEQDLTAARDTWSSARFEVTRGAGSGGFHLRDLPAHDLVFHILSSSSTIANKSLNL